MNFYSDVIINDILDHAPLDKLTDQLQCFMQQCRYMLTKFSIHTIHHNYTSNIINDPRKIVAFYCLDQEFCIANCPSALMYRKCFMKPDPPDPKSESNQPPEIRYYVLFTCTKKSFRGMGYASKLFDGFLERVREEKHKHPDHIVKIVLSSLESSVLFYESYGFRWTRKCISEHPVLLEYEKYQEGKEYFILEMLV
jgi:ribosomal protein S18 acetylase RimI-like enzyme